jgi:RNA polymerase sigma-70 factor (ECF subfamily)
LKKETQNTIDSALFGRLARGEEEAFGRIVHAIYEKLFPFTVSLVRSDAEADDIMQEVFLKIWLHRASFATIENPMGWIHTLIANTASNHLRALLRRELRIKKLQDQATPTAGIEDQLDARFTQSLIDEAVSRLPAKRKQVFLLSRREGLSRKEIASRLNISENTVRNQLAEAMQSIRDRLDRKGDLTIP